MKLVHFVEWKKVPDEAFETTLKELASWGVSDLVAHPVWGLRDEETPGYLEKTARAVKSHGMNLPACHAYWGPQFDISNPDREALKKIVEKHAAFLRKLAPWGIRSYTLHITWDQWESVAFAVEKLLPAAAECGIALALENGTDDHAARMKLIQLIHKFSHPMLGICFDTGHANCYGERDWQGSWLDLGAEAVTCHMHDNYGTFDDHNPPGKGNLDWTKLVSELKKAPRMLHAETESGDWSRASWEKFREKWNSPRK